MNFVAVLSPKLFFFVLDFLFDFGLLSDVVKLRSLPNFLQALVDEEGEVKKEVDHNEHGYDEPIIGDELVVCHYCFVSCHGGVDDDQACSKEGEIVEEDSHMIKGPLVYRPVPDY